LSNQLVPIVLLAIGVIFLIAMGMILLVERISDMVLRKYFQHKSKFVEKLINERQGDEDE